MANKDIVIHLIIIVSILMTDTIKGEQKNPCSANSKSISQVSVTQYVKVSESDWNEYYQSIQKNSEIKIVPGYIPISYSYETQHPSQTITGCNCIDGSSQCLEDKIKNPTDETEVTVNTRDCGENREGVNCELCKPNFFNNSDGLCTPCHCNKTGSLKVHCDPDGKCQCKPGVTGDICDLCEANSYGLGPQGCQKCTCNNAGTERENGCDSLTGSCSCKKYVEGYDCEICAPGHFNLNENNEFGCTPCFCYGHSTVCNSAVGYGQVTVESTFSRGTESWSAKDLLMTPIVIEHNAFTQNLKINNSDLTLTQPVYFLAPDRFLGDHKASYNQEFSFTLRVTDANLDKTVEDVVLEGAGLKISQAVTGLSNILQEFSFILNENPKFGWIPTLSTPEFIHLLSNLTAIKIRGTYSPEGASFLDNVRLRDARRGSFGESASWVEICNCSEGYTGQFCESCAPGYFRDSTNGGGPMSSCIPCTCNGHSNTCDSDTGDCFCENNTRGSQCEECSEGFYGNPLNGTTEDCQPCACSGYGGCLKLSEDNVACIPKHASSIIFPKTVARNLFSNGVNIETHSQLSTLTSEEIENLPGFEFVKDLSNRTPRLYDGIRK